MLKKVICLLLVLVCSFALFACGEEKPSTDTNTPGDGTTSQPPAPEKPGEDSSTGGEDNNGNQADTTREQTFFAVVNNSHPNEIVTVTSTSNAKLGSCVGYYKTVITGENSYSFEYEYQKFNSIGEGTEKISTVGPHTVTYADGMYTLEDGTSVYIHPDSNVMDVKLDLNKAYLGSYAVSGDGTQLTTAVSAENAEKLLGVKITATSQVEITVKTNGTYLSEIMVSYVNGNNTVVLTTSYTYVPVAAQ